MIKWTAAAVAGLALGLLALPQTSSAQDLTCADIEFTATVTDQYADIAEACTSVVERNGKLYARLEAQVIRPGRRSSVIRFKHTDGSFGPRVTVTPESPVNVYLSGAKARLGDLERGQDIRVYLPSDRWAIAELDEIDVAAPVETHDLEEPTPDVSAALPTTASPLPLIALGGLTVMGLGALLRSRS